MDRSQLTTREVCYSAGFYKRINKFTTVVVCERYCNLAEARDHNQFFHTAPESIHYMVAFRSCMNELTAIWGLVMTSKASVNDVNETERGLLIL